MSQMTDAARKCALVLLDAGGKQKRWTPEMRAMWTRAFNACNKLAGRKIRIKGDRG